MTFGIKCGFYEEDKTEELHDMGHIEAIVRMTLFVLSIIIILFIALVRHIMKIQENENFLPLVF